jgi:hypothetical protein
MAKISLILATLFMSAQVLAGSELADLVLTHALIRNQTILYKLETPVGEIEYRESTLFTEMQSDEDCKQYDPDGEYNSFRLITVTEEPNKKDEAGFSRWVEGDKVDGFVIAKTTQFCFAREIQN